MAQNKNALLRYRTIDRCLRNTGRRWTLQDLVDACSDALYEYEGKQDMVSTRTVQLDIQMMRSDRLGYEAPIEVYDKKYYRYSDPDYSISNRPLSKHDIEVLNRTIDLLRQFDEFDRFHDMADVVSRLQDKVATSCSRRPIVDFERKPVPYIIFPYLLKEYRNRWFVFGSRQGDMKLFNLALDRIVDFHPCPDIPYKENPDFGNDFFDDVVGVTKHSRLKKERILLRAENSQASYILTKPIHSSQRLVEKDKSDGSMIFELEVVVNWELISQLIGFGAGIKILEPASLAARLREIFKKASALYS